MIDLAEEWKKRKQNDFWLRQTKKREFSMEELYDHRLVDLMEAHYKYVDYPGPLFKQILYFYNLLHQIGMRANVQIITRSFSHLWDLMLKFLRLGYELPHGIKEKLLKQLKRSGHLIEENNGLLIKSWHKDALIWYPVDK